MEKKKILFITHDVQRTGAPMLLLDIVGYIHKTYPNYSINILLDGQGPLVQEFAKFGKVFQIAKIFKFKIHRVNAFFQTLHRKNIYRKLNRESWEFIFSNTIINGKYLEKIDTTQTSVFTYVHELENSINMYDEAGRVRASLEKSNFFFCGSEMVRSNLIKNKNVNPNSTEVVYSFCDVHNKTIDITKRFTLKAKYNMPQNAMVVAMLGTFNWRKGNDLFIKTSLENINQNIYFLWIGVDDQIDYEKIKYDVKNYGLTPNLLLLPSSEDYKEFYNVIDVLYLSSREDPYPLVMVEASSYGIQTVCFKGGGGTEEFLEDFGLVANYGNTAQVLNYLDMLEKNRDLLLKDKHNIISKSIFTHDIEKNIPKIFNTIKHYISKKC